MGKHVKRSDTASARYERHKRQRREHQDAAKAKGLPGACDLCGRPVCKRYGWVWLRNPSGWKVRAVKRKICKACYTSLQAELERRQDMPRRDHLPCEASAAGDVEAEWFFGGADELIVSGPVPREIKTEEEK